MLRLFVRPVLSVPALLALLALGAGSASAALPRTYDLQRVDSPAPSTNGNFGRALAVVGDVNADGEQDLLVGNDKHGRQAGQVFVISGADGSMIRELQRPDTDIVGSGRASGFGAAVGKIGFNQDSGPFSDVGSCPLGDSGDPDAYCDNATVGAADGIPDLLVTASGVDVDPAIGGAIDPSLNNDLGVAYVFDGRTGALLKKLLMPAVDRQMEVALDNDPRYGRAALSPNGLFPCVGHAGIGPCPALPAPVAAGDIDGGGTADILVAATDFDETPANSHPLSPCATSGAPACPGSGRVYTYSGEAIAGSDPTVVDETPDQTITDLYSKADGGSRIGTTLTPVGDLGQCTTNPAPAPGSVCPDPSRSVDGQADYVSAGPDFDAFGFDGTGTVFLMDGDSGTILRRFDNPEPQPVSAMGLAQNGLIQPAFGDLGQSTTWDFVVPSTHQNVGGTAVGRAHLFNGDLSGRDRFTPFAQLNDPTPQSSGNFGASAAGLGQVDDSSPTNEVMVGAIGPHAPGTNRSVINDVHMFRTIDERALQSFPDPAQEQGSGFGEGVAPLGDVNDDGFLDFAIAGGGYDLTAAGTCAAGCTNAGRIYIYRSNDSATPAPAPPGTAAGTPPVVTPPPARGATMFTAKLSIARTTINRSQRVLDVLAPITSRASGRVRVELHAAGQRYRFTAPVDSVNGRIRFRQRIPAAQARLGTGIVTITYAGDSDTRPQTVRLRAASRKANLQLERPQLADGRLRAAGSVNELARGVVRVQLEYVHGSETKVLRVHAPISNGRWSVNHRLSAAQLAEIGQRIGTVHSYTLFTGYLQQRMRGEMRSFQVLGDS
ncbi:MAG: integrin alpha [Thermoleophilia bacterium]